MRTEHAAEWLEKKIVAFSCTKRPMPAYSEITILLDVKSKRAADFGVRKLVWEGLLEKGSPGFPKGIRRSAGLPLVGEIRAGFPSPAEEELRDIISLDEYLITRPESSFLLQVTGDSMMEGGILEGDLVIIEKGRQPKNGDIVVAEVDGEWTLKYFRRQGKETVLEAANPRYPMIRAKTELRIGGVVSALVRKYHG